MPRLRGLRLAVSDGAAALALFERMLALSPDRGDGTRSPRLHLGSSWLELRDAPGDTLALQCSDLARQRTHLQRLGIEALDGAALGCTPCLRLEAVDTGACAVDLQEAPPAAQDTTARDAVRLLALTLSVRSPERVAQFEPTAAQVQARAARAVAAVRRQRQHAFEERERRGAVADGQAQATQARHER